MAAKRCKKCREKSSKKVKICPHCGAKKKAGIIKRIIKYSVIAFIGLIGLATFVEFQRLNNLTPEEKVAYEAQKQAEKEIRAAEKAKAAEEAQLRTETIATEKAKADEEARLIAETEAAEKARIKEEMRLTAKAEAAEKAKAEEATRILAEAEAAEKARIKEEMRLAAKAEAAEKAKAEEAARILAEAEAAEKAKAKEKVRLAEEAEAAAMLENQQRIADAFTASGEQAFVKTSGKVTGDHTIEVEIETNIPFDFETGVSLSLTGQSNDEIAIGTNMKKLMVSKGKTFTTFDVREHSEGIPSGEYELSAMFYPLWQENKVITELLGLGDESIGTPATIDMVGTGELAKTKKARDKAQQWVMLNVSIGDTFGELQRKNLPDLQLILIEKKNAAVNFLYHYSESADITVIINSFNGKIVTWRIGRIEN